MTFQLKNAFSSLRRIPHLFLGAALLIATPACSSSQPKLIKIDPPAAGSVLQYDLSAGQHYVGTVRRSETIDHRDSGSVTRSISLDIDLLVNGAAPEGGILVTATFKNISLNWSLPRGVPFSLSDFTNSAKQKLQGTMVSFRVNEQGKIIYMPTIPDDISEELGVVIQQALDALEAAFFEVPERAIKPGDQWSTTKTRGRKDKLGRYVEGTVTTRVDGFYRLPDSDEELAKLILEEQQLEVITAKSGSHQIKRRGTNETLFSTKGGYLLKTKGDYQTFDAGNSTTMTLVQAEWKKGQKQVVKKRQRISDPCDPDYVGTEECASEADSPTVQPITDPCDPNYVGTEKCGEP